MLFVLCTIIGTLLHELGHVLVAEILGYDSVLHYGGVSLKSGSLSLDNERDRFHDLLISIGGPAQTITSGVFGLSILYFRRIKKRVNNLKLFDWVAIFLSLFWLREVFNLVFSVGKRIAIGSGNYFNGDEARISMILGLPSGMFPIILGIVGLLVGVFVVYKVVPYDIRTTFILSGLIGGTLGFILWMKVLGPKVLP